MGKQEWRNPRWGQPVVWGVLTGAIALSITSPAIGGVPSDASDSLVKPTRQAPQMVASTPAIADLAAHLKRIGAKMYGAYWCPHCTRQKAMFGSASDDIPYVECDPRGENPQPQQCRAAGIKGYPTWEINGKQFVGVQSLEELAEVSGFKKAK